MLRCVVRANPAPDNSNSNWRGSCRISYHNFAVHSFENCLLRDCAMPNDVFEPLMLNGGIGGSSFNGMGLVSPGLQSR
jgi:hypothetical protein